MLANLFKSKAKTAALGDKLVALSVKSGRVPDHCDGISLYPDGSFDRHPTGEALKEGPEKKIWLIHQGPYAIQFAPNEQAPEVGVEVELRVEFREELSLFLYAWESDAFTREDLQQKAKQIAGPYLIQPGMNQSEIMQMGGVCANFSNAMQAYGFSCHRMQRIDLGDQINTADLVWKDWTIEQIDQKTDRNINQEIALELGENVKTEPEKIPLLRLAQFDQKLITKLQRELGFISKQLFRLQINNPEQVQTLSDIQQQLYRCQAHSQLLPPIKSDVSALKLSRSQQKQRLRQLQVATGALKNLKIILNQLTHSEISLHHLNQLADHLYTLQTALQKRAGTRLIDV